MFHDKKILMTIEQRRHLEMAFHRVQSTRGLVQTGLHLRSARFDSTQQGHHMTWGKPLFQVWRREGNGCAMLSCSALHKKEKWHPELELFFKNQRTLKLIFSTCIGQTNITRYRAHKNKDKNIANIIVQYKGIVQCFLAQQ